MADEYVLDVTTETKNYKYTPETVEVTKYYLVVKADIPQENQKDPEKKEEAKKSAEKKTETTTKEEATKTVVAVSENPQTGDNVIKYMVTLLLSAGMLYFLAVTNLKRKLN